MPPTRSRPKISATSWCNATTHVLLYKTCYWNIREQQNHGMELDKMPEMHVYDGLPKQIA